MQKRDVDIRFDKVKRAIQLFPRDTLYTEQREIISDEFLAELLSRRETGEFKNIVFSIQKKQGEIIQTPFKNNIIVQGCAGSGKSMIMLHRLPILLADNPNDLNRNGLYIITPSQAYIDMVRSMMLQLEISDIKKGTFHQYYEHLIEKYQKRPAEIGTTDYTRKLTQKEEEYIYSDKCIRDINRYIDTSIKSGRIDYKKPAEKLNVEVAVPKSDLPKDILSAEIRTVEQISYVNGKNLKAYFSAIREMKTAYEDVRGVLKNYKNKITGYIVDQIEAEENTAKKAKEELEKLSEEENQKAVSNRKLTIQNSIGRAEQLNKAWEEIEADTEYFNNLQAAYDEITEYFKILDNLSDDYEKNDINLIMTIIESKSHLKGKFASVNKCLGSNRPYMAYEARNMGVNGKISGLAFSVDNLRGLNYPYISAEKTEAIEKRVKELADLQKNLPMMTYKEILKQVNYEFDDKKRKTLSCAPYIYLRILYEINGRPNAAPESLVSIDEAQSMALNEFRLIKAVNGERTFYNLFGDEKQHIEGTKGLKSWDTIKSECDFITYSLNENYRNVSKITEYCNKKLKLDMKAINLAGNGAAEYKEFDQFKNAAEAKFAGAFPPGLNAIIVSNNAEAEWVKATFGDFADKFADTANELIPLQKFKWNIITVDDAKGLEFNTVIAISGNMTPNRKYISYTRALDELLVYDKSFDASEYEKTKTVINESIQSSVPSKKTNYIVKPRITSIESGLADYFKKEGLQVVDERPDGGRLWVYSSDKSDIKEIVAKACNLFNVSGNYGISIKTKFKQAWSTKSNK